jgi:hypothetical protein
LNDKLNIDNKELNESFKHFKEGKNINKDELNDSNLITNSQQIKDLI